MDGERRDNATYHHHHHHRPPPKKKDVKGQPPALSALGIGEGAGRVPERGWNFWRRKKILRHAGIRNLDRPSRSLVGILTEFHKLLKKH